MESPEQHIKVHVATWGMQSSTEKTPTILRFGHWDFWLATLKLGVGGRLLASVLLRWASFLPTPDKLLHARSSIFQLKTHRSSSVTEIICAHLAIAAYRPSLFPLISLLADLKTFCFAHKPIVMPQLSNLELDRMFKLASKGATPVETQAKLMKTRDCRGESGHPAHPP